MGKMITLITMLVFIDLMFIFTGQLTGSLGSSIFEVILDVSLIRSGAFWTSLIGTAGIASLLTIGLVTVGFIVTKSDMVLFIPMAIALSILATDFIAVYNILRVSSPVLATAIMAPIIIVFTITVTEWLRGRD